MDEMEERKKNRKLIESQVKMLLYGVNCKDCLLKRKGEEKK